MSQMHSAEGALQWDLLDRLHKAMRVGHKSATALAVDLGIHRNTVNNYLTGRTAPDRRTLIAWAMSCHVPVEWLEKGEGGAPNPPTPGERGGDGIKTNDALARLTEAKRTRQRTTTRHAPATRRYPVAA